jgi:hypothetical protein
VPVCDTTIFYAIKPPKSKDEIYQKKFETQQKEIDTLKSQLNKFRKSRSKKDRSETSSLHKGQETAVLNHVSRQFL